MNARTLLNLGLLILVGLLVAVVVFEPGKEPEPEAVLLTSLDEADVTRIHITRKDKDDIELEKRDGHWFMTAPFDLPANDYKAESIMKLLKLESAAQYDMEKLDPARFDLREPAIRLRFNDDLQIDFGNTEPLQHQRYVRIGQTLHLIPDYYYYQLAGDSSDYLDHGLIPKGTKITRLELPGFSLNLQEGKWTLEPADESYPADAYTDLLNEWRLAQAIEIRKPDSSRKEKTQPIKIFLQGREAPLEYRLLRNEDDFILQRPDKGVEYVMAADKAEAMLQLQKPEPEPDRNEDGQTETGAAEEHSAD